MEITKELNTASLEGPRIYILPSDSFPGYTAPKKQEIGISARIGISKGTENPLRFYLKGSRFISHTQPLHNIYLRST